MDWLAFGMGYGTGFLTAAYMIYLFHKAKAGPDVVQKAIKRALKEQN